MPCCACFSNGRVVAMCTDRCCLPEDDLLMRLWRQIASSYIKLMMCVHRMGNSVPWPISWSSNWMTLLMVSIANDSPTSQRPKWLNWWKPCLKIPRVVKHCYRRLKHFPRSSHILWPSASANALSVVAFHVTMKPPYLLASSRTKWTLTQGRCLFDLVTHFHLWLVQDLRKEGGKSKAQIGGNEWPE